ncbi:hypothetical protein GCM10009745_45460 [Kribbella yunnanensis]|uniref:Uncharacterized protein n=1 Tax=Kribbella yunnanensis TaxID=190194 RepID=A0ABN2HXB2_9ACTN
MTRATVRIVSNQSGIGSLLMRGPLVLSPDRCWSGVRGGRSLHGCTVPLDAARTTMAVKTRPVVRTIAPRRVTFAG